MPVRTAEFMAMTPQQRFDHFVYPDPNSGCWLWGGDWIWNDYGRSRYKGAKILAHHMAWLLAGREIPAGLWLLHKCDTRCCVNPDHLYLGTNQDNGLDKACRNRGTRSKLGLPYGVGRTKRGRYNAQIKVAGERLYLGTYATPEEAAGVALQAKAEALRRAGRGA
jgi:hypothetical protein